MELKRFQKTVMANLSRFLELLTQHQSCAKAYSAFWQEQNVPVGFGGMPAYQPTLGAVPHVCLKVPTGGGKTFLAANAVKPLFDAMPTPQAKAVVWLVPSDAILSQTYRALSDPDHPYRQKLDVDFGGRVEVYAKAQLLCGQNFSPASVVDQLSVFVLSYDSFRTNKKEGRKAYQENGHLAPFARHMKDKSVLLPDTDESALIQVVRSFNPVVIVDESHHATSTLSVEMLANFNPCFVLDLTATPKKGSNIIAFVDAVQLKKESMVKLPVIVYNRRSQTDVFGDAISLRCKLEAQATREQETTGRYIRPIVLFQAQPRTADDSTTYQKIKEKLMEAGIAETEIKIKTADRDELKGVDLLSPACPVRYIITVNALKEGWDCPFAYVLATVANRTSAVDVEQILGRVLRLPYTRKNQSQVLNLSYVITSSADFQQTLDNVVKGLNGAGFSAKDYRAKEAEPFTPPMPTVRQVCISEDVLLEVDGEALKRKVDKANSEAEQPTPIEEDEMLSTALTQNEGYERELTASDETAYSLGPREVREKMNVYGMNEAYAQQAATLCIPQFALYTGASLFREEHYTRLEMEHLTQGFTLKDKDVQINFAAADTEMARVDIDDGQGALPKAWKITGMDSAYFKEWFVAQPQKTRLEACKQQIRLPLSRMNCINDRELNAYIDRVVDTLTEDQIADLEQSPYLYALKVEEKVKALLAQQRRKNFDLWLEQGKIICMPTYRLPATISPTAVTSIIPNSLYTAEEEMNAYEHKVVWQLSVMDNIQWWHRNISRLGFGINGPVHAYPDIIARTHSGKLLIIETKGDHLDNAESKEKAWIGAKWASLCGASYRYFMVFETKQPDYPGAYGYDRFMEIVKGL